MKICSGNDISTMNETMFCGRKRSLDSVKWTGCSFYIHSFYFLESHVAFHVRHNTDLSNLPHDRDCPANAVVSDEKSFGEPAEEMAQDEHIH